MRVFPQAPLRFLRMPYTGTMQGYYTYPDAVEPTSKRPKRIALVVEAVRLEGETRGQSRIQFLARLLSEQGFEVDLITSTFQHWDKAQRDTTDERYQNLPYRIRFVYEPDFKKNIELRRIRSHAAFARNLRAMLESRFADNPHAYDLIYSLIPMNDMARTCAEVAHEHGIPFIVDVNDLWPEAMRMAIDVPVLSDVAFAPFARDAKRTYELATAVVGTSDEYADRPAKDRTEPYIKRTVYVGNDLSAFDSGAQENASAVTKPEGELWVAYAGTTGKSQDLATLVEAMAIIAKKNPHVRCKLLGDGPDRPALEQLAQKLEAPVDFIGYVPHGLMAAYLCASDVTVNSLVKTAAQSIVTKIGDYLAAGIPLVNTGLSPEFCAKVEADGFGVNVQPEDAQALADTLLELLDDPGRCAEMGKRARTIAEEQFDQKRSYLTIVELIRDLTS